MAFNYPPYNPYNQPYSNVQPCPAPMYPQAQQIAQAASQPVQQGNQGLSGTSRPVTNREEAVSTPADFSGALMVFPDLAHNRVYLKRWNMNTGNADFVEFAPVVPADNGQRHDQAPVAFASLQEFQDLQNTVNNLQAEIERLKKPAGKAVKKNDPDE